MWRIVPSKCVKERDKFKVAGGLSHGLFIVVNNAQYLAKTKTKPKVTRYEKAPKEVKNRVIDYRL